MPKKCIRKLWVSQKEVLNYQKEAKAEYSMLTIVASKV
jgi:hypothetical protein